MIPANAQLAGLSLVGFLALAGARAEEARPSGSATDSGQKVEKAENCPKPPKPQEKGLPARKIEVPSVTQTVYCSPSKLTQTELSDRGSDQTGSPKKAQAKQQEDREIVSASEINSIALAADLTMKNANANAQQAIEGANNVLKTIDFVVKAGGVALAILSGFFALFQIKGVRDMHRMNKQRADLEASCARLEEARVKLEAKTVRDDEQILEFLPAFRDMILADTFKEGSIEREGHFKAAAAHLKNLTEKMKGGDNTVRGTILAHLAYAHKRLRNYEGAFQAAREAVELRPETPSFLYNAACYACLAGRNDSAFAYLKKAIASNPRYRDEAPRDSDFQSLWNADDFKKALMT